MKILHIISYNEGQTQKYAESFAQEVKHAPHLRGAIVLALKGELGSGKTAFVKGFARGLGIKDKITSPTFILVKRHTLLITHYKLLVHIDAYRLKSGKDLRMLGWDEWMHDPKNIICIEWPERVKDILPRHRFEIKFKHAIKGRRELLFYIF